MSRGFRAAEGRKKSSDDYRVATASKSYSDKGLRESERALASRPDRVEHLYGLDENGNVLFKTEGKEMSVRPTQEQVSQMIQLGGKGVMTHNHPTGQSFSAQDIVAMLAGNYGEIRAVGKEWTYSLSDPKGKFKSKFAAYDVIGQTKDLSPIYGAKAAPEIGTIFKESMSKHVREAEGLAESEMPPMPSIDDEYWVTGPDDLTPEGKELQDKWDREYKQRVSHIMVDRFAKEYGLVYKRFPTNP